MGKPSPGGSTASQLLAILREAEKGWIWIHRENCGPCCSCAAHLPSGDGAAGAVKDTSHPVPGKVA